MKYFTKEQKEIYDKISKNADIRSQLEYNGRIRWYECLTEWEKSELKKIGW